MGWRTRRRRKSAWQMLIHKYILYRLVWKAPKTHVQKQTHYPPIHPPAMRLTFLLLRPLNDTVEWHGTGTGLKWLRKTFTELIQSDLQRGWRKNDTKERQPSWGSYKKHKTRAYRLCNNHSFRNCRKINCKTNGFPYSLHICIYSFFRVQQVVCGVCTSTTTGDDDRRHNSTRRRALAGKGAQEICWIRTCTLVRD